MGAPRAGSLPPSDAEPSIPDSVLDTLSQQGYTIGEVIGHSTAPSAPRHSLGAQGRHVIIRVVDLPRGRAGAIVLRRLADLRVPRHPGLTTVREVVSLPERRTGVIMDLVGGAGLDVALGARGRLNVSSLTTLPDVLDSALACLHEHGTTHGDVSSGNVLVTAGGRPILVDLLDFVTEMGTQECAVPERLAGVPPSVAGDVYALARLLTECSGQGGTASRRLAGILTDTLAEEPAGRPTTRGLAARMPQLGRASPIELPNGACMAAGLLRAAARTPTRTIGSRLRPKARPSRQLRTGSEPRNNHSSAGHTGRGPVAIRWRRRGGSGRPRTYTWGLTTVALMVIYLAAWGPAKALVSHRPMWALRAAAGSATSAWPLTPSRAGAIPSGSPSSLAAGSSAAMAPIRAPGESSGVDVTSIIVGLSAARDRTLMIGNTVALVVTTVPGSPATRVDTQVFTEPSDPREGVKELHTSVSQVAEVKLSDDATEQWAGARTVQVTLSRNASARPGSEGTRTVPALAPRQVVLTVVPEPWRVADIRAVE